GGRIAERDLLVLPQLAHDVARLVVARLQEDGAEHGLDGVGEDGRLEASAAAGLALGQHEEIAEAQRPADLGTRLTTHETVQVAGQLAFGGGRIGLLEKLDDGEAQHAVADELKALVVLANLP